MSNFECDRIDTDLHKRSSGCVDREPQEEAKISEVLTLMKELEKDPNHVMHVRDLALQLFDQLKALHFCGSDERVLLECGALLHDIGYAINEKKHHKHAMLLILQNEFQTLDEREEQIVANLARYHRRSMPKLKHNEFALLSQSDQLMVRKMAALLRVADGLDRGHAQRIKKIHSSFDDRTCQLFLESNYDCEEEFAALQKKKNLFERIFGIGLFAERKDVKNSTSLLALV